MVLSSTGRRNLWFGLAVAVSLVILFKPGSDGPLPFWQADKLVHASTFALLAVTAWWRFRSARWILLCLVIYAGASEIIQHYFIPGREWDILDVAADTTGAIIGLWLARRYARIRI